MRVLEMEADSRDAAIGEGARSVLTNAHEVEQTHPRERNSTSTLRRTAAARGAARYSSADFTSAAAKTTPYVGFR
jgi:hypothetical protein